MQFIGTDQPCQIGVIRATNGGEALAVFVQGRLAALALPRDDPQHTGRDPIMESTGASRPRMLEVVADGIQQLKRGWAAIGRSRKDLKQVILYFAGTAPNGCKLD